MTAQKIAGYCPMGCGATLTADQYQIICTAPWCPRPSAVSRLLAVDEPEHVVVVGAQEFTVRHPLRERLDGELEACLVHQRLLHLDGPPVEPGTWKLHTVGDDLAGWAWEQVA